MTVTDTISELFIYSYFPSNRAHQSDLILHSTVYIHSVAIIYTLNIQYLMVKIKIYKEWLACVIMCRDTKCLIVIGKAKGWDISGLQKFKN